MIVFVGLQGSGKSTYYNKHFVRKRQYYVRVSKDLMTGSSTKKRDTQREMISLALLKGLNVIVDNTSVSAAVRKPLIDLGHLFGARVVAYWFPMSVKECVARNAQRKGKAKVPNVAIYTMAKKFEDPTIAEGFDEVMKIVQEKE